MTDTPNTISRAAMLERLASAASARAAMLALRHSITRTPGAEYGGISTAVWESYVNSECTWVMTSILDQCPTYSGHWEQPVAGFSPYYEGALWEGDYGRHHTQLLEEAIAAATSMVGELVMALQSHEVAYG